MENNLKIKTNIRNHIINNIKEPLSCKSLTSDSDGNFFSPISHKRISPIKKNNSERTILRKSLSDYTIRRFISNDNLPMNLPSNKQKLQPLITLSPKIDDTDDEFAFLSLESSRERPALKMNSTKNEFSIF